MEEKKNVLVFTSGYTGDSVRLEFDVDSDVEDWVGMLKTVMLFATFTPNQVEEAFGGEYE